MRFTFGAFHSCKVEYVRRFFAPQHQGRGQALLNSLGYGLGGMIGAIGSGLLWDSYQNLTFVIAAGLALLAIIITWFGVRDLRT